MLQPRGPRQQDAVRADGHRYDVFISYSRRDAPFARRLQRALGSYTPPADLPVPQRRLRIFRDESDFQGTEYEVALGETLRSAGNLLVVCSPSARASPYVGGEIATFAALRGKEHIVSVLLAGVPNNETPGANDERDAFHDELVARLPVPLAADYRGWDETRDRVDRDRFEGAWYKLLADIYAEYGVDRSGIEQREKMRRRRTRRIWTAAMTSLTLVLASLTIWALISRREAIGQRNTAQSRFLAAQSMSGSQPYDVSLLLAVAAHRTAPTFEAWEALFLGLQRQSGIRRFLHGVDRPVRRISAGRGGTCTAVWTDSAKAAVWDLQTGVRRFEIPANALPDHACRSVVLVSDTGVVEMRPLDQLQQPRWAVADAAGRVTAWAIDPGDKTVAIAQGGRLVVRSLEDGRLLSELIGAGAALTYLRYSAGGQEIAGIDTGGMVHRWRVGAGTATPASAAVRCVANPGVVSISPDLRWCGSGAEGQLVVTDLTAAPAKTIDLGTPWILALDFSRDSRTLMAGVQGGNLQFWDLERVRQSAGPVTPASWSEHRSDVTAAVYAADGNAIVSAARDGSMIVWHANAASRLVSEVMRVGEGSVAATDAGATRIVVGTRTGDLTVSPVGPGSAAAAPRATVGQPVTAVALREGGEILAGSANGALVGVDAQGQRREFTTGHHAEIVRIRLNHDESRAAVAAEDGVVTISDVASGRLLATFAGGRKGKGRAGGVTSGVDGAFEPGGTRLVSVHGEKGAFLWDWSGGTARWSSLAVPLTSYFTGVAFGPDHRTIALGTGMYEGEILLMDAANPAAAVTRLPGHDLMDVTGLAFSPDGRVLFSGGFDGSVAVWDVAGRRRIGGLHRAGDSVTSMAYAANGSAVTAVTGRGAVLRWALDPGRWTQLACGIANRELSAEERARFSVEAGGPAACR